VSYRGGGFKGNEKGVIELERNYHYITLLHFQKEEEMFYWKKKASRERKKSLAGKKLGGL